MTKKNTILTTVAILCVITSQTLMAQNVQNQQALDLVKKNAAAAGLTNQNIIDSRVSDTYLDALSGATLVYLQQTYKGIDVDKSLQVLAFKSGSLVSSSGKRIELNSIKGNTSSTLQKDLAKPSISAQDAIQAAAKYLNLPVPQMSAKSGLNQDFSKPTDFGTLGIA